MCKYYSLQKKRQRNFNDWLANVLDLHLPVHSITQPTTKYSTDGFVTLPFNGLPRFLVYIEVENRVGKGRSNPFMQGLAYFYHFNEVNSEQSLCLCFIIELIGPHLGIYGVVNVGSGINKRKILADLLANLWSVDKCTDYIGMMLILWTLKAFKMKMETLNTTMNVIGHIQVSIKVLCTNIIQKQAETQFVSRHLWWQQRNC